MIRHRCAACGHHINRTDHLFEDSDGTLCAACLTRLAPGRGPEKGARRCAPAPLAPAWAMLPDLAFRRQEQG
ncbi:MAG: hypothetical protein RDU24_08485 [Humidesulfovibrio sp.]|uniref:hypothetical protein n=1 Tax=Humidesulfovibrio sp. TaxID=2910988 RepID=UPI0027FEA0BB|nr:hypothetical protein [Humidesulfovibrio sp.]MDQ7835404.1 hypothetical protein [Humidesulfovibrio sp.]